MRTVPKQKPGKSEQTVATPWELIRAIEYRFGKLQWDLAANADNAKAPNYITFGNGDPIGLYQDSNGRWVMQKDSLNVDWHRLNGDDGVTAFLNPPFSNLEPWVRKCYEESLKGAKIFLLTPLTCAKWYVKYILGKAYVMQLGQRVRFVGHKHQYPKDLMISWFNCGIRGTELWNWNFTLKKNERSTPQPK